MNIKNNGKLLELICITLHDNTTVSFLHGEWA